MSDPEVVREKKEKKVKKEKKHKKHDDEGEVPAGSDWGFGVKKYRGPVLHKDFIPALYHYLKATVSREEMEGVPNDEILGHYHHNFPEEMRKWGVEDVMELWVTHLKKKRRSEKRRGSGVSPLGSEGVSPVLQGVDLHDEGKPREEDVKVSPVDEALGLEQLPEQPPVPPPLPTPDTVFLTSRDKSPDTGVERKASKASEFDLSDSYIDAGAAVRAANSIEDSEEAEQQQQQPEPVDEEDQEIFAAAASSGPPTPEQLPSSRPSGGEKFTVRDLLERVNAGGGGLGTKSTSSGNMKALASQMVQATGKSADTRTSVRDSAPALNVDDKSAALRLENFQRISESGRSMVTVEEQGCVGFYSVEFLSTRSVCVMFKCYGKVSFTTSAVVHLESPISGIAWDSRPPATYLPASTLLALTDIGWPSRHFNGSKQAAPLPILTLTLDTRPLHLIFSPSVFAKTALVAEQGGVVKACSMAPCEALKEVGMEA